jgi:hypothetical protein
MVRMTDAMMWEQQVLGSRICILLGPAGGLPQDRTAVAGRVIGFAARSAEHIDVELDRISTWVYGTSDRRAVEPGHRAIFRVGIQGSIARTWGVLAGSESTGRSALWAMEVSYERCPNCGDNCWGAAHCGGCGMRIVVSADSAALTVRPRLMSGRCTACWAHINTTTPHCTSCGAALDPAALSGVVGSRITIDLASRRQKVGRIRGVIDAAAFERPVPAAASTYLLRLSEVEGLNRAVHPLPEGFAAVVGLNVRFRRDEELMQHIRSGAYMLRATEIKRRCENCTDWSMPDRYPEVLSRFCPRCGLRARVNEHPDLIRRAQVAAGRQLALHACGAAFRRGEDRNCGGCGVGLEGYAVPTRRFRLLG